MTKRRYSRVPAWLDFLQSASGLLLGLFIVGHILFEASILFGPDAMEKMTLFFEGYYLFGQRHPGIVSALAAFVFALFIPHAFLAIRKSPPPGAATALSEIICGASGMKTPASGWSR
ncbi:hypothetical protein [Hydrogenimonas sp.]